MCIELSAFGQVTISVSTGVGTYAMRDMKRLQTNFIKSYQVDGGVNKAFPPYIYYEGTIGFSYSPQFFSEIYFAHGSTGGRVSYGDYSGEVAMTQRLNYTAVMGSFGVRWRVQHLQFDALVRLGRVYSRLTLSQVQSVDGSSWSHNGKYTSAGGVAEPNFKVTRIFDHVGVFVFAGFNETFNSGFFESVDTVDYITTPQGTFIVAPDWTGVRIGTGVTLIIGGPNE